MCNKFSHCANQFCGQVPNAKSNKSQGWDWEKEMSVTACGEGQRRKAVCCRGKTLDRSRETSGPALDLPLSSATAGHTLPIYGLQSPHM